MRVHVIGSGSSKPSAVRTNSSYLLRDSDGIILLDCSGSPAHSILKCGYDLRELRGVYLTHAHVDHVYALPSLIHSLWLVGAFIDSPLPIYGPADAISVGKRLVGAFDLESRPKAVRVSWNPIDTAGSSIVSDTNGNFPVVAHPVTHGNVQAVGFQFGSILFSGDCVYDVLLDRAAAEVAEVVVDCGGGLEGTSGHAGARQIAHFALMHPEIRKLYLTHLDSAEDESKLLALFASSKQIVRVLVDGETFAV